MRPAADRKSGRRRASDLLIEQGATVIFEGNRRVDRLREVHGGSGGKHGPRAEIIASVEKAARYYTATATAASPPETPRG